MWLQRRDEDLRLVRPPLAQERVAVLEHSGRTLFRVAGRTRGVFGDLGVPPLVTQVQQLERARGLVSGEARRRAFEAALRLLEKNTYLM